MYLSYLMGTPNISDQELLDLDIEIVESLNSGSRKLKLSQENVNQYKELVKKRMDAGFWNEIVGGDEIVFIFKTEDKVVELLLTDENKGYIAKLCSKLNGDPIEKTSNVLEYLAENDFYSEFIRENYSF